MERKPSALELFDSIDFSDLLLKVEIDSTSWVGKTPREKLQYLRRELGRVKNDKVVSVVSKLISSLITLVRYNTSNPIVNAYLGVIETGLGLAKTSMVLDNVFISAKREIRSEYDQLAQFMGIARGIDVYAVEIDVTPDICKAFLNLSDAQQKKYGLTFTRLKSKEDNVGGEGEPASDTTVQTILVNYVEAKYRPKGCDYECVVGFEIGFYSDKKSASSVDSGSSFAYANAAVSVADGNFEALDGIDSVMYAAYIDSIDISKNIIDIRGGMLRTTPRPVIDFEVRNFDLVDDGRVIRTMESEVAVIRSVLDNGDRRGYIVQGDQGTGKTISVNKLLMEFTDVPVFWISANSVNDSRKMLDVFRILYMFPGSIFVFDDFDGNDLSAKNELTTTFISCIDETTSPQFRGVLFLIINEPQRLHSTIKLRPGRIDDIIYVKNPSTVEQVEDIIVQRFVHMKVDRPEWLTVDNEEFRSAAELIISSSLTHAFISGIVNDLVKLNRDSCTCERFRELIMRRKNSIRNAKMVALEDGHIAEMDEKTVVKNRVITITNTQGGR